MSFSGYTELRNFDPDTDGLVFDLPLAKKLHRTMNLLEFVRKRILSNKAKFFDQNVKALSIFLTDQKLSENWDCKRHDKALLKAFSDYGDKDYVTYLNNNYVSSQNSEHSATILP